MRKGKLFTKARKVTVIALAAAMVVGVIPLQNTKAADNSP